MSGPRSDIFIEVTFTSLFSPLLEIRIEFIGQDEKIVELGERHDIIGIHDSVSVQVKGGQRIHYEPDREASGRVTLTVSGGTEDTGWRNYPLMATTCQIELSLPPCDRAVAQFRLPEKLHLLPDQTSLRVDGNKHPLTAGGWKSYPNAQQTQYIELKRPGDDTEIRYSTTFRESAVAVLAPITFPALLNLLVPLLAFTPAEDAIKISVSIAVLPLYFRLWNWSNMMEIAPTFTNMITTEILLISAFNLSFVLMWAVSLGSYEPWMFFGLAIAYLLFVALFVHDSLRFIFDPDFRKGGITFSIQKVFFKVFNERVGDSLKGGRSS